MKLIKYLVVIFSASVLIAAISSYVVDQGLRKSKIELNGKLNFAASASEKIELLLIGSSRVLDQINPKIIDSVTKLNSYNFGVQGATIKTCFNVSQFVLNHQPSAKIVVLNIDFFMFNTDIDLWKDPRFYPYECCDNRFAYDMSPISDIFHKLKVFDISFYDDNIKYIALDGILRPNRSIANYYKGYSPRVTTEFGEPTTKRDKKELIVCSEKGLKILRDLILMCKNKKVKLAFVFAPYQKDYFPTEYFANYSQIIKKVDEIADSCNIPKLDFSTAEIANHKEYFFDFNHLNSIGADIYSGLLAEKINSMNSILP